MPKIKVKRIVEEEIDGTEVIVQLRKQTRIEHRYGTPFLPGDIVDLDTPKNREDGEKPPTVAIITEIDASSRPLCCAYFDEDGDLIEDEWWYAEGVTLIEPGDHPARKLQKQVGGADLEALKTPEWAR